MVKKHIETIAAIDVGSNYLRMIIAQVNANGEFNILEDLRKNTNIGKDSFSYGRIDVETIQKTYEVLKDFAQLMRDYQIKHYRAVCTSGIREAENRDYILDQIKSKSGINVEIINNAEERFLIYKALRDNLQDIDKIREEGTIIVNVGSGGLEITVYSDGKLQFTEYIKVGSLRLREILSDLERITVDFPKLMEEFIGSKLHLLEKRILHMNIKNFIALGGELSTISSLNLKSKAFKETNFIKNSVLEKLYSKVCNMNTEQIVKEYEISEKQAEGLLPSVIIFNRLFKVTKAEGMYTPRISLRHGILSNMIDELFDAPRKLEAIEDIISSVWYIGKKFGIDEIHSQQVEKLALSIFDQTKKVHKLNEKERIYLKFTAVLHDVGKYINLNQHEIHSYDIINSQDIMGFSSDDLRLVANIARYHTGELPQYSHINYQVLTHEEKIIVSKLAAILRLAEAMDISHKQKIKNIEIIHSGDELIFKIENAGDILLEKWNFGQNIKFFEEVMGVKTIIKNKG